MKTYEDGLNDAWVAARKVVCDNGYDWGKLEDIFDMHSLDGILSIYTASEAVEKIKEYEEKQKEPVFKVGDRVRTLVDKDKSGTELFPVGTIGEVVTVDENSIRVKAYETDEAPYYYPTDALELANDVIIVGDEVTDNDGWEGVVTWISPDGEYLIILQKDGTSLHWEKERFKKTGRHFPQISEVLKQMQEGEE